jgi:hypothetical protein
MVEGRWGPTGIAMTILTPVAGREMGGVFASRLRAIVAA